MARSLLSLFIVVVSCLFGALLVVDAVIVVGNVLFGLSTNNGHSRHRGEFPRTAQPIALPLRTT